MYIIGKVGLHRDEGGTGPFDHSSFNIGLGEGLKRKNWVGGVGHFSFFLFLPCPSAGEQSRTCGGNTRTPNLRRAPCTRQEGKAVGSQKIEMQKIGGRAVSQKLHIFQVLHRAAVSLALTARALH